MGFTKNKRENFILHARKMSFPVNIITRFLHGFLVENQNVLQHSSHGAVGDVVGAVLVEELGIRAKVVLLWQLHERLQHVLVQDQVPAPHLKLGRLHCGYKSHYAYILHRNTKNPGRRKRVGSFTRHWFSIIRSVHLCECCSTQSTILHELHKKYKL